jgi:ferredoxin
VKRILKSGNVKYVIGYEKGTYGWRVTPLFARTEEEAERFIFSPLCMHNLLTYITLEDKPPLPRGTKENKQKVGIIVKGCDSRAAVQLINEKVVERDDLILIGIPCSGVVDPKKMKSLCSGMTGNIEVRENGEAYTITGDNGTKEVSRETLLCENCKTCEYQNPVLCDTLIGKETGKKMEETYRRVSEIEEKPVDERFSFWKEHFDRCIRCYACRNSCPVCCCEDCMAEKLEPVWIRRSVDAGENTAFHVLRAFHMAGRCAGCGSCERACPVNIPLTLLYKKIEKSALELFDNMAGITLEEKPLLASYRDDDSNDTIL